MRRPHPDQSVRDPDGTAYPEVVHHSYLFATEPGVPEQA